MLHDRLDADELYCLMLKKELETTEPVRVEKTTKSGTDKVQKWEMTEKELWASSVKKRS